MISQERSYVKAHEREQRPHKVVRIISPDGKSAAEIASQGAAINELHLAGSHVLTSAEVDWLGLTPGKRDTSHSVLPFGPNGDQPQHGLSRYLDYEISTSVNGLVEMNARDRLLQIEHSQEVWLGDGEFVATDEIINFGDKHRELSFGKHYYFSVPGPDIPSVRISQPGNDIQVRRPNGELLWGEFADFWPYIKEGEPLICEDFSGQLVVQSPENRFYLSADAITFEESSPVASELLPMQLAIWHRPGEDTLCFEPLTGVKVGDDGELFNNQVLVAPGCGISFHSSIEKL